MDKQELIDELKKEIEATKNVSNFEEHVNLYGKGKRVGLEFGWMLAEKLDEPEITEEQAWEVIENSNHYHMAPSYVYEYKRAIQNGVLPNDFSKPKLPVIPQFVGDWIANRKAGNNSLIWSLAYGQGAGKHEVLDWLCECSYADKIDREEKILKAWELGYTIEPPKTLQVIVKNYDSTVFKTELPEDEAMKLIEGWKGR